MSRPQALQDRLHRAKSWMNAAETLSSDQKHMQFIFFYIAFNALYGRRQYEGSREEAAHDRDDFLKRLQKMTEYDKRYGNDSLRRALQACQKECEDLITNHFLRDSYWRREKTSKELRSEFAYQRRKAVETFQRGQANLLLDLALRRLSILRNQIMHGCVTYGPLSKGLSSVDSGLPVLKQLVPVFYMLMEKYGQYVTWPAIPYPRVGTEAHPTVDDVQ